MKKILAIGVMAILLCGTVMATAFASDTTDQQAKAKINDGQQIIGNIVLNNTGMVIQTTTSDVVSDNGKKLKGENIPESWKNITVKELEPTEADWAYIEGSITDLSKEETNKFIGECKKIYKGTSKLSAEEQSQILQRLGSYIANATEGNSGGIVPMFMSSSGHQEMSLAAGNFLAYPTATHVNTLGDNSWWADEHRDQPPIGVLVNRHSWVLGDVPVPFADNYGPDSLEYFMNLARNDFNGYNVNGGYVDSGKGLHYIEDLGCPFHTSSVYGQVHHTDYEEWVSSHWSQLDTATNVDYYYLITDPSEDSKYLAGFSHGYLQQICDIMNTPGWQDSTTLVDITRTLISETERMAIGMEAYSTKFESPNTVGGNSVPIYDYQTSYAYIDNVACSESMYMPIGIDHTYIGDLEVWIGCKDDSSSTYTEYKVWDHQGGDTDNLYMTINLQGFSNVHDWRLRVMDTAGADQGAITEFIDMIG